MHTARLALLLAAVFAAALPAPFAAAAGAPAVTGVEVTSERRADATYALGETVEVTVRFSEAVDVTGAPGLAIDMDPASWGEKRAAYARGSGTASLVFAHAVVEPNYSPRGIAVLGNTLALNGGSIRSASSGAAAALAHTGLPHNAAHKVDWRLSPNSDTLPDTTPSDATPPDTTPPRLVRGEVDGATMRLVFSEALDAGATGGAFRVTVQTSKTGSRPFYAAGPVTIDGAVVTVGLGAGNPRAQAGLDGNRVRYLRRADTVGALRDLAGNLVAAPHRLLIDGGWRSSVSIALVNVTGAAPVVTAPVATGVEVTGVAVTSDAGDDATYALGETVEVTVRFNEAVTVDTTGGTPGLAIDMDPASWGEKRAAYARGSGTAALVFAHAVVEPNYSTLGVAVLADTLALNGGTIRSASSGAEASLMHVGLPHNAAHKVDWQLSRDTTPPELLRGEVDGATMRLTFSEVIHAAASLTNGAFTVKKTPPGGSERDVSLSGTPVIGGATVALTLANAVLSADTGVKVSYRQPTTGTGNWLRDAAGNEVADFTDEPVTNGTRVVVSDVEVSSDAGDDATYALRDVVRVTVTFSEAVAVTGAPRLKLALGAGAERWAAYASGSRSAALAFAYTVAQADASSAGVAVLANTLALNGGTIRSAASGRDAALAHGGRAHDAAHKVDGALPDITPPRLSRTVVDGAKLTLAFTEAIDDAASPANGAFTVQKTPPGGSEETVGLRGSPAVEGASVTLSLAKAVRGADTGVKVSYRKSGSDAGNRLRDESGNEVAEFSDRPVANSADTTPPTLVRGEIEGTVETLDGSTVTLHFSEALDEDSVGGEFLVDVQVGYALWHREQVRDTGRVEIDGSTVTFRIRTTASAGTVNRLRYNRPTDGTTGLRDLAGNEAGSLRLVLHNSTPIPPSVTGVAFSSDAGADRTYVRGETIRVTVTFSEAVNVTGTPRVKLDFSSEAGNEKWAAYASGSGTKMLEFAYTVAEGDTSGAGVAVLKDTLELNDGTIESSTAAGESATLAHARLDHDPTHRVDGITPTLSVAGVQGAKLTLIFDKPLDAAASLANDAFTVKKTQGGSEQNVSLSRSPAINGATVTLTLADAVLGTDTDVKVSYTRPATGTGNRLRDEAGNEVASFSDKPVTYGDITPPELVRGEIDDRTMILYFSEPLDEDSVGGYFRVKLRVREDHTLVFTPRGEMEISGNTVVVDLGKSRTRKGVSDRYNWVFYFRSLDPAATKLRDLAGNEVRTPHAYYAGYWSTRRVGLDNVTGVARLSVADARANEGAGASVAFTVSLSSAATGAVTVDYATADGSAAAGADYTATSGTLTFAAGETAKTVSVPVLDDAVDEGEETFTLRLSNATGARIADGEATGTIANDDPLQTMWLSRFGRTVASHVTEAVSDRLSAPLAGSHVTVASQRVDLAQTEDGAALTQALTAVARAFGASGQPAPDDGFGSGLGQTGAGADRSGQAGWPGTAMGLRDTPTHGGTTTRDLSGRELLLGSAFHLAREGDGAGPGLAAWGRVTAGGFDGEAPADAGRVRIDGEVTTGILGADAEWNRLLAGVAVSVSEGEGRFDQPGVDSGTVESTMTAVSPYARFMVNDRLSVWGLAGWGSGDMTIAQAANDRGQPERITRTDLSMRLAAVGGRGALMEADETGGIDLGLRADAFWVETEAEAVSNEGGTTADASRVRLALEGSRAFEHGRRRGADAGRGARASP